MNSENTKKLYDSYPEIFEDKDKHMSESVMCWGFECGDGWFNLIDAMCWSIQSHIKSKNENIVAANNYNDMVITAKNGDWSLFEQSHINYSNNDYLQLEREKIESTSLSELLITVETPVLQVVARQLKEKFGTLRFYYSGGDEYISGVVDMAEAMSATTCEVCGDVGYANDGGWIRTRCEKHKEV